MKKVVINYSELSKKEKIFYWIRKGFTGTLYVTILVVLTVVAVYSMLDNGKEEDGTVTSINGDPVYSAACLYGSGSNNIQALSFSTAADSGLAWITADNNNKIHFYGSEDNFKMSFCVDGEEVSTGYVLSDYANFGSGTLVVYTEDSDGYLNTLALYPEHYSKSTYAPFSTSEYPIYFSIPADSPYLNYLLYAFAIDTSLSVMSYELTASCNLIFGSYYNGIYNETVFSSEDLFGDIGVLSYNNAFSVGSSNFRLSSASYEYDSDNDCYNFYLSNLCLYMVTASQDDILNVLYCDFAEGFSDVVTYCYITDISFNLTTLASSGLSIEEAYQLSAILSGVGDILAIRIYGYFSLGNIFQIFIYIFVVLMFVRMFAG